MVINSVRDMLAASGVGCSIRNHPTAYTAQEVAHATHISGSCLAKNVILWIDGQLAMAVVPATCDVDLEALKFQIHAEHVRLAERGEFANIFGESQLGAAPPFGNLFDVKTYVDIKLALRQQIVFNAGTHTEVVEMSFADYSWLAKPLVLQIAMDPAKNKPRLIAKRQRRQKLIQQALREEADAEQVMCSCEPIHPVGAD